MIKTGEASEVWFVGEQDGELPNRFPSGWNSATLEYNDGVAILPNVMIEELNTNQVPNNWAISLDIIKRENKDKPIPVSPDYPPGTTPPYPPDYRPQSPDYPPDYRPQSPDYPPDYRPQSPDYPPDYRPQSPDYPPGSPNYPPGSPNYPPGSPNYPPGSPNYPPGSPNYPPGSPRLCSQWKYPTDYGNWCNSNEYNCWNTGICTRISCI